MAHSVDQSDAFFPFESSEQLWWCLLQFRAMSHINHSIAMFVLPHQACFQILTGVSCICVCLVSVALDTGARLIPRIQLSEPSRAEPSATQKPWTGAESQSTAWTNVRHTLFTHVAWSGSKFYKRFSLISGHSDQITGLFVLPMQCKANCFINFLFIKYICIVWLPGTLI